MEDKNLDNILKSYFTGKTGIPEQSKDCPSYEALAQYALGTPSIGELYDIGNHVRTCKACGEVIESALLYSAYGKEIKLEDVPARVRNKAKSINPAYMRKDKKLMTYLKKNIWFILCMASFIASFFAPRHFLQFLVMSVIFGLKWVFDKEATRTLIMVYNAWKKHDKTASRDLEEIFKDRL